MHPRITAYGVTEISYDRPEAIMFGWCILWPSRRGYVKVIPILN